MPRSKLLFLFGLMPMFVGCFAFQTRPPEIERPLWRPSDEIPPEQKSCVYTFVFGTLDPFDGAHAGAVRDFLIHMGFVKTYYGQSIHLSYFADKMREISANCPMSRFAIVGYSGGSESASELAIEARKAGIPVELLVFIEPCPLNHLPDETVASQTMTIRSDSAILGIQPPSFGEVITVEQTHPSAVPTHAVTIEILERELNLIALGVDLPGRADPVKKPLVEPFPAPRNKPRRVTPLPAEWRFLQPYGTVSVEPMPTIKAPALLPENETLPAPRILEPENLKK